ncbi:MAG TPA: CBS domain-containing protein [Polyangiaceae bacterium]|nr:CBS domain-containing protein [Polyangiaceae bacterium]
MAQPIRNVMSRNVLTLSPTATLADAARTMRDSNVGAVIVEDQGKLVGLVTDRDIVVRAVAQERDPKSTQLSEACSKTLVSLTPDDDTDRAVEVMREKSVRRLPVVEKGKVVGILTLGDLALERDRKSVLGSISAAPPNR